MDGLNHYAYVSCNPIVYTDPTGLETTISPDGKEYWDWGDDPIVDKSSSEIIIDWIIEEYSEYESSDYINITSVEDPYGFWIDQELFNSLTYSINTHKISFSSHLVLQEGGPNMGFIQSYGGTDFVITSADINLTSFTQEELNININTYSEEPYPISVDLLFEFIAKEFYLPSNETFIGAKVDVIIQLSNNRIITATYGVTQ